MLAKVETWRCWGRDNRLSPEMWQQAEGRYYQEGWKCDAVEGAGDHKEAQE